MNGRLVGCNAVYQVERFEPGNSDFGTLNITAKRLEDGREFAGKYWDNPNSPFFLSHLEVVELQRLKRVSRFVSPVLDHGSTESEEFVIFEHLPGKTVAEEIDDKKFPLSKHKKGRIVMDVVQGLRYFHEGDLVHADVSPKNIRTRNGNYVLVDFDLVQSRHAFSGRIKGQPPYIAPEGWKGKNFPQTDVYALGVVIFELYTGKYPFGERKSLPGEFRSLHTSHTPIQNLEDMADAPAGLGAVVMMAMAKDVHDRYASAAVMQRALERVL